MSPLDASDFDPQRRGTEEIEDGGASDSKQADSLRAVHFRMA